MWAAKARPEMKLQSNIFDCCIANFAPFHGNVILSPQYNALES